MSLSPKNKPVMKSGRAIFGGVCLLVIIFFYFDLAAVNGQERDDDFNHEAGLEQVLEGFEDPPKADKKERGAGGSRQEIKAPSSRSGGTDDLDIVLDGFEDGETGPVESKEEKRSEKPPIWKLSGSISLGASYGFSHEAPASGEADYRGFSRIRPDLHLRLDGLFAKGWKMVACARTFYDFAYDIKGRDQYPDKVLDEYEMEVELSEAYLQGRLSDNLDLKIGRQIVVWGKSDNLRVVDVLNPLDNREPGLIDIEDLRLPVTMTRLDYYAGPWNVTGLGIHEHRFNKNPVFGSEFFFFDAPLPKEKKPADNLDNTEYALAINGIFSGWDLSFYAAYFFDDQPHLEMVGPFMFEQRHSRLTMIGAAMNIALGNWLLKSEAAFFDGLEFFSLPDKEKSRFDLLVGLEYSGFSDTLILVEAVNRHIDDYDPLLKNPPDSVFEDEFQWVFRYTGNFINDTIHVVLLASFLGPTGQDGALERFSLEYDIQDALSVQAGLVLYQSGDNRMFKKIGDNDRLFLEAKYSF